MNATNEITKPQTASAEMIVQAAQHLGAEITWRKFRHGGPSAIISFEGGEVVVEDAGDKLGARIESDDGSRDWYYDSYKNLAGAIRRRVRAAKAADVRDEARRKEMRERELAELEARRSVKEQLAVRIGEDKRDALCYVDSKWDLNPGVGARAWVNVSAGKFSGERLTVDEAVHFIVAMESAGYDLLAMEKARQPR